jgi:hypothetical protein
MAVMVLAIGAFCVGWPGRVQQLGLKWSDRGLGRLNPWLRWMRTRGYISFVRANGILLIVVALLLSFVALCAVARHR